jgi:Kef-type K+ transport system membrane component KefB
MNEVYGFLIALVVILVSAKVFGEIAVRLGQSAIAGELIAGIIIGPSVLVFVSETPILSSIAELGAVILLFEAGISSNVKEFVKAGGLAALVAFTGVVFPYLLRYFTFLHFGLNTTQAVFAGAGPDCVRDGCNESFPCGKPWKKNVRDVQK